jgi:hypothetical protein
MIESIARTARPVLEFPIIRRTRRNHALEHATIHMLTRRMGRLAMSGRSTDGGFVLFGAVDTSDVEEAAEEALRRMQKGEQSLALHPNCGTNLVTAGTLTTLAGVVGLRSGRTLTPDRLTWTMLLMVLSIIVSQPLGMSLQKHITTKGEPGNLEIVGVTRREIKLPFSGAQVVVHNVYTRFG